MRAAVEHHITRGEPAAVLDTGCRRACCLAEEELQMQGTDERLS